MLVPSQLTHVKVYDLGATVYREVHLAAEGGRLPEEIEVAGLPLALYDPTARVRVASLAPASAELVVTGLRVGLHLKAKAELPPEPDREALKRVGRRIEELEALLTAIRTEKAYLADIRVPARPPAEEGKPPPASPIAARLALDDFVQESTEKRQAEERALRAELAKAHLERADLGQRLARASNARTADAEQVTKSVIARLVQGAAPVERAVLVLEYFVPGARWLPTYQCRLSRDGTEAEVQLRAAVCQRSGEDWRGVKLSLSTASPLAWTELPELSSQRIGKAQAAPPTKRGFRPPPRGSASLFEDYDRDRRAAEAQLPATSGWAPSLPDVELPRKLRAPAEAYQALPATGGSAPATYGAASAGGPPPGFALGPPPPAPVYASAPMAAMDMDDHVQRDVPAKMSLSPRLAPAQLAAVEKMAKESKRASAKGRMREEGGGPEARREGAEMIVYTSLRLAPPASAAERSRLTPVDVRAAYLESLARFPVTLSFDPVELVERATDAARAVASVSGPPLTAEVRGSAGHFDYAYDADAPVDVPSDGAFHSVALGSRRSTSSMRYVVVPREDTSVFRIAKLDNPLEAPMLAGPAELYVGGEYVLTTRIATVPGRGKIELGLGVEQAIKCARNTRYEEKRSGSKVVATNELAHGIEITLANNLGREIEVEVRERIPQPAKDAEVVVEEGAVVPPWEAYEQAERSRPIEGGRRWNVKVAPHAEVKVSAEYVVKIYANNEISGGNRRES